MHFSFASFPVNECSLQWAVPCMCKTHYLACTFFNQLWTWTWALRGKTGWVLIIEPNDWLPSQVPWLYATAKRKRGKKALFTETEKPSRIIVLQQMVIEDPKLYEFIEHMTITWGGDTATSHGSQIIQYCKPMLLIYLSMSSMWTGTTRYRQHLPSFMSSTQLKSRSIATFFHQEWKL